jgi:hypothetical protein
MISAGQVHDMARTGAAMPEKGVARKEKETIRPIRSFSLLLSPFSAGAIS